MRDRAAPSGRPGKEYRCRVAPAGAEGGTDLTYARPENGEQVTGTVDFDNE